MSLEKRFISEIIRVKRRKCNPISSQLDHLVHRMRTIYALPKNNVDKKGTIWDKLMTNFIEFVLLINATTIFFYIFGAEDIPAALESFCILVGFLLIAFKFHDFNSKAHLMNPLFDRLNNHYFKISRGLHPKMRERFRFLFLMNGVINYTWAIILGLLLFLALTMQPLILLEKVLPMKAKYPFKIESVPTYLIVSSLQAAMYGFNLALIVVMDSLAGTTMMYMNIFFENLTYNMELLGCESSTDAEKQNELRKLILEHQYLLK